MVDEILVIRDSTELRFFSYLSCVWLAYAGDKYHEIFAQKTPISYDTAILSIAVAQRRYCQEYAYYSIPSVIFLVNTTWHFQQVPYIYWQNPPGGTLKFPNVPRNFVFSPPKQVSRRTSMRFADMHNRPTPTNHCKLICIWKHHSETTR